MDRADRALAKLDQLRDTVHTLELDLEVALPERPVTMAASLVVVNPKVEPLPMVTRDTEATDKLHLTDSSSGKDEKRQLS